jgi:hypothetical protein
MFNYGFCYSQGTIPFLFSRQSSRCSSPQSAGGTVTKAAKKLKRVTAAVDDSQHSRVPLLSVEQDSDGDKEDKVIVFVTYKIS